LKLADDDFYIYVRGTHTPPVLQGTELELSEMIHFAHLKRLGACRKGEAPLKEIW
jgi:hypothetical protein